jgi:hypothetical protein
MSRPKPKVLTSHTNAKSYVSEQVLHAKAMYAVCYDGHMISLKTVNSLINDLSPKYRRTCFPESPGHAHNLVDRLNAQFKTDKFAVHELAPVRKVTRDPT